MQSLLLFKAVNLQFKWLSFSIRLFVYTGFRIHFLFYFIYRKAFRDVRSKFTARSFIGVARKNERG